jgi:hypothetical protein
MIRLCVQAFSLPKGGSQPEEYEDAWAYNRKTKALAIADGASDAFESRFWAHALVQAFMREPPPIPESDFIQRWLEGPIHSWRGQIDWERLPWYAEEKARRGAFAALLGLSFALPEQSEEGTSGRWQAMAVGDACLFQVRGDALIAHFPVEQAADFGVTPTLLSTQPAYNVRSLEGLRVCEGEWQPRDLLVLATDALAAWFLREWEAGRQPWQEFIGLNRARWPALVQRLRTEDGVRNDDMTLLLARCQENSP